MVHWAVLRLKRLERFSRRALIRLTLTLNISVIIANIAKWYQTFLFVSIFSITSRELLRVLWDTLYISPIFFSPHSLTSPAISGAMCALRKYLEDVHAIASPAQTADTLL